MVLTFTGITVNFLIYSYLTDPVAAYKAFNKPITQYYMCYNKSYPLMLSQLSC